jgi:hypothetical protein
VIDSYKDDMGWDSCNFNIACDRLEPDGAALARSGAELELEWAPVHLQLASLPKYYLMLSKVRTSLYGTFTI